MQGQQLFFKIKDFLQTGRYSLTSTLFTPCKSQLQSQFNSFMVNTLSRYVNLNDVWILLMHVLVENVSPDSASFQHLAFKLDNLSANKLGSKMIRKILQDQKLIVNYHQTWNNLNAELLNLKFYKFPLSAQKHQLPINFKLNNLVAAINTYESFLISMADQKPTNTYNQYRRDRNAYTKDMLPYFQAIEKMKTDLKTFNRCIQPYRQKFQFNNIEATNPAIIERLFAEAQEIKNEFEQTISLFTKVIPYIQQKKQLPSKYTVAPNLKNKRVIQLYDTISREIRIITLQTPQREPVEQKKSIRTYPTRGGISRTLNPCAIEPSQQQFIKFVNKVHANIIKTKEALNLYQKMDEILNNLINKDDYSAQIIEEVTKYSAILNPLIEDCLRFFSIPKQHQNFASMAFTFSQQDIKDISRAVTQGNLQKQLNQLYQLRKQIDVLRWLKKDHENFIYDISSQILNFSSVLGFQHQKFIPNNLTDRFSALKCIIDKAVSKIYQLRQQLTSKLTTNSQQYELLTEQTMNPTTKSESMDKKTITIEQQKIPQRLKEKERQNNKLLTQIITIKEQLLQEQERVIELINQIEKKKIYIESKEKEIIDHRQTIAELKKQLQSHQQQKGKKDQEQQQQLQKQRQWQQRQRQQQQRQQQQQQQRQRQQQLQRQHQRLKQLELQWKQQKQLQRQRERQFTLELQDTKSKYQEAKQLIGTLTVQCTVLKIQNNTIHEIKMKIQNELQDLTYKQQKEVEDNKKKIEGEIGNLTQQLYQLKQNLKICMQQLTKSQDQNKSMRQQKNAFLQDYTELHEKYLQLMNQQLEKSIIDLKITEQNPKPEANILSSLEQSQNTKAMINQLQNQKNSMKKQYEDQISKLKSNENLLSNNLSQLTAISSALQQETNNLKQTIYHLETQNRENKAEITRLNKQLRQNQTEKEKLKKNLEETNLNLAKSINNQNENKINSEINTLLPPFVPYNRTLLNQDIFLNDDDNRDILIDHLEKYNRSKIVRTNLVYKYDPKNQTNFHQYIDNIKGLLIVVKTYSTIIAGFYPGVHKDKEILSKGGLLVSVTNNKSYTLREKKPSDGKTIFRGMIFDTYYAIFGNAQIRVKTGLKTVFSNFGVNNSFFDPRGDKIDKFLNQGDAREVEFMFCEFYEVILQKERNFF